MPEKLRSHGVLRRRLGPTATVGAVVLVLSEPGRGEPRSHRAPASPDGCSPASCGGAPALSSVVIFRAVFCPRTTWRLPDTTAMARHPFLGESCETDGPAFGGWRGVQRAAPVRTTPLPAL